MHAQLWVYYSSQIMVYKETSSMTDSLPHTLIYPSHQMANVLFSQKHQLFIEPPHGLLIYSFLHSFPKQTFIKHLQYARHCV